MSDNTLRCFNCGYKCSYTAGRPLYPKFMKMLEWLGASEATRAQLKLESLKITASDNPTNEVHSHRTLKEVELPTCTLLANSVMEHPAHVGYLAQRGFTPEDFPFLVSPEVLYRNRIIMPFIMQNTIVGYSARIISGNDKMRFLMKTTTDVVFGLDSVKPEDEWIILSEGLFDALSVGGLAVMHNEINAAQAELINRLEKRIIVVPQLDSAGLRNSEHSLIQTALTNGWNVAFPEWDCKDLNQAYVKYGRLFVIKHILNHATTNEMTIKLKQKMLSNRVKNKVE